MRNPITFTKDGKSRTVSNLYEFIKLIYNDNQMINEGNVTKLFNIANNHEKDISDIYKHINRLYRRKAGLFITAGAALGIIAWYRTHKNQDRIRKLEEQVQTYMANDDQDIIDFLKYASKPEEDDKKEE